MPLLTLARPILSIWPAIVCVCVYGWLSACTKKPRMPITCGAGQSLVNGQCVTNTQPAKSAPDRQDRKTNTEGGSENDQPTEDTRSESDPDGDSPKTTHETGAENGTDPKPNIASLRGGSTQVPSTESTDSTDSRTPRQIHPPIPRIPVPRPVPSGGKGADPFPPNPTIRKGNTSSSPAIIDYYDLDGDEHETTLCNDSQSRTQFTACLDNNQQNYRACVVKNNCGVMW